jgi:ribosomal protein S19
VVLPPLLASGKTLKIYNGKKFVSVQLGPTAAQVGEHAMHGCKIGEFSVTRKISKRRAAYGGDAGSKK